MANQLTYTSPQTGKTYQLDDRDKALVGVGYGIRSSEWAWGMDDAGTLTGGGRKSQSVVADLWCEKSAADDLFDAFEADALAGTPGTLTAQRVWETHMLAIGSELKLYGEDLGWVHFSIPALLPDGCWRKTTRVNLPANSATEVTVGGIDLDDSIGIRADLDLGLDMPAPPPAPIVTTQPKSVKALSSTTVTLWAHVKGYHVAYQWQQLAGGAWVIVPGATRSALTLDPGTVGTFRMIATDAYGRTVATDPATVESAGVFFVGLDAPPKPAPPSITVQPQDVAASSTTQAVIWLHAIGYRLSYQWEIFEGGIWDACAFEGAMTSAVAVPVGTVATLRCVVTDAFGQQTMSDEADVTAAYEGDTGMDTGFDLAPAVDNPEIYVTPYERRESYAGAATDEIRDIAGGDLDCDLYAEGSLEISAGEDLESWAGGTIDYGDVPGPDLGGTLYGAPFAVTNASGALVRIYFRGACSYPYVLIAGNRYAVNAAAARGESIVIDPTKKREIGRSVYRASRYGDTDNLFDYRERDASGSTHVFDRVPKGEHRASWPQEIEIDLDVIEERGTPPWSS